MAQTATPLAVEPKVIGFIHVVGCQNGAFELYIFYDNQKILHIDESNTPGDDVLKKLVGDIKGFTRKFACGVTA
jgi:hypothetical protein